MGEVPIQLGSLAGGKTSATPSQHASTGTPAFADVDLSGKDGKYTDGSSYLLAELDSMVGLQLPIQQSSRIKVG